MRLTKEGPGQGSAHNNQDDALQVDEANSTSPQEKHSSNHGGGDQVSTETPKVHHHNPRSAHDKQDRHTHAEARVPASEVLRLLRAGMLEDYRRASPSLSATCIYREFAEGLREFSSMEGYGRASNNRYPSGESPGLSKAELCEYFEAITDLVDLNHLSLVQKKLP